MDGPSRPSLTEEDRPPHSAGLQRRNSRAFRRNNDSSVFPPQLDISSWSCGRLVVTTTGGGGVGRVPAVASTTCGSIPRAAATGLGLDLGTVVLLMLLSSIIVSSLASPSLLLWLWLWWWRVSATTDSTERLQLATVLSAEMAVKLGTIIKGMVERSLSGRSLSGISVVGSPASWSFFMEAIFDGTAATDGRLGFVPLISSSLVLVVAVGQAGSGTGTMVGEHMVADREESSCGREEAGGMV